MGGWRGTRSWRTILCMSSPVHHAEGGVRRRRANRVLVRRPARMVPCIPARTARALEVEQSRPRRDNTAAARDAPDTAAVERSPDDTGRASVPARARAIGMEVLAGLHGVAAVLSRYLPRSA